MSDLEGGESLKHKNDFFTLLRQDTDENKKFTSQLAALGRLSIPLVDGTSLNILYQSPVYIGGNISELIPEDSSKYLHFGAQYELRPMNENILASNISLTDDQLEQMSRLKEFNAMHVDIVLLDPESEIQMWVMQILKLDYDELYEPTSDQLEKYPWITETSTTSFYPKSWDEELKKKANEVLKESYPDDLLTHIIDLVPARIPIDSIEFINDDLEVDPVQFLQLLDHWVELKILIEFDEDEFGLNPLFYWKIKQIWERE